MTHSAIGARSCEQCGSALQSRALFCSSCGTAVPRDMRPPDPVARPKAWFEQDGDPEEEPASPDPVTVTDRVEPAEPELAEPELAEPEPAQPELAEPPVAEDIEPEGAEPVAEAEAAEPLTEPEELVDETPPMGIGLAARAEASGPETAPLGITLLPVPVPDQSETEASQSEVVTAETEPTETEQAETERAETEPEETEAAAALPAGGSPSWSWGRDPAPTAAGASTGPAAHAPAVTPPAQVNARSNGFADPQTGPMSIVPAAASWSAGRVVTPDRLEVGVDTRVGSRADLRTEARTDTRTDNRTDSRTETRSESRSETLLAPLESLRPSTDPDRASSLVRPPTPDYRVVELAGRGSPSTWASRTDLGPPVPDVTMVQPVAAGHGLPPPVPPGQSGRFGRTGLVRIGVPVLVAVIAMAGVLLLFRSRSDAGTAALQPSPSDPRTAAVQSWQEGNTAWSRGDITLVCDRYDGVGAQGMWATVARCQAAERQGYDSTSGADRSTIASMTVDPTTAQTLPDGTVVIWYRNARVGGNPVAIFGNEDFAVMRQLDGQGWRQVGARYSGTVVGSVPASLSTSPSGSASRSASAS